LDFMYFHQIHWEGRVELVWISSIFIPVYSI
jgi:hypothetical protein